MHRIFITGGSGYVGAMLVVALAKRPDVAALLVLDKDPASELFAGNKKVSFIQANTAYPGAWLEQAKRFAPDVVIHAAWQIRELYGKGKLQHLWNIDGTDAVFDFALSTPSVKRLIHFSTVAAYGAFPDNEIDRLFTEADPLRPMGYRYADEKRITEEHLAEKLQAARKKGVAPAAFVVRPASITGPRGRYGKIRFGLQSALSGEMKTGVAAHTLVAKALAFVPVTKKWCRQFIHEDDVIDIITLLSLGDAKPMLGPLEAFNLCPPGPVVRGEDMARAVGKKAVSLPPWLIRIAFFFARHISLGKIPTSRGVWKTYSYPIAVDGSKLSRTLDFRYSYGPQEAFTTSKGRYSIAVP